MLLKLRNILLCGRRSIFVAFFPVALFWTVVVGFWHWELRPDNSQCAESRASACKDAECIAFRRLLAENWPFDKPRAAVVMLVSQRVLLPSSSSANTTLFGAFAQHFDTNFNDAYNYPVIVFFEPDKVNEAARNHMRASTRSTLFFQRVEFKLPLHIDETLISAQCGGLQGFGFDYRHMCRFQAVQIYQEPIIDTEELEYVLRLDDDSMFTRPVGYDMFRFMRDRKLHYGYALLSVDSLSCIVGLEQAVRRYKKLRLITPGFDWQLPSIIYNNFEISSSSFWRSTAYRNFTDYIDRLGGIYYYRWGDAPIKSLAVALLLQRNVTHQFSDVGYMHQGIKNN
jgi:alpha 1,2-mannosyltransferase